MDMDLSLVAITVNSLLSLAYVSNVAAIRDPAPPPIEWVVCAL